MSNVDMVEAKEIETYRVTRNELNRQFHKSAPESVELFQNLHKEIFGFKAKIGMWEVDGAWDFVAGHYTYNPVDKMFHRNKKKK